MLKRISPSMIVALIALFFALSGGAYAANKYIITTTKQIKPSALAQIKGRNGTNGVNGANGAVGPAGQTGAPGQSGPAGPQGPAGAKGDKGDRGDPGLAGTPGANGAPAVRLWALVSVNDSGSQTTLVRGSGVASVSRENPGRFHVRFDHNVSECAYTAQVALTDSLPPTAADNNNLPTGNVLAASTIGRDDEVHVLTTEGPGASLDDRSFVLAVHC